jgi:hypothetical protein
MTIEEGYRASGIVLLGDSAHRQGIGLRAAWLLTDYGGWRKRMGGNVTSLGEKGARLRVRRVLMALGLGVLAAGLMLPMGQGQRAAATEPSYDWHGQEMTHTIHLPLAARTYVGGYVSPFGIAMYGNVGDGAGLDEMEAAGSAWVTTFLHWSRIESVEDSYDWSSFDAKAQNAQAAGMDVFVLFTDNPSWAAALPGGPVTDTQDLVEFATDMAERYDCDGIDDASESPCVHTWSFYAEPDNGDPGRAEGGKGCWGDDTDPRCGDGVDYAAMLSQVSPAIHGANPKARVLIGGLAYDYFEPDGPFVQSFLTDTLAALNTYPGGAEAYIDAIPFHYYPINPDWETIREKTAEIRGIMARHGVGDLPLICPEMGYWSSPLHHDSSEKEQARRVVEMYVRGLSMDVEVLSWFKVFDDVVPESKEDLYPGQTSGLFRVDGSEKPAYRAYQTMTGELAQARYLRELDEGYVEGNVEGYVFQMADGREKTLGWAETPGAQVVFPYACLRLVDTEGNVYTPIRDGDGNWDHDGTVNGEIALAVFYDTPFYVAPCR